MNTLVNNGAQLVQAARKLKVVVMAVRGGSISRDGC